jgi:hypothetical protein
MTLVYEQKIAGPATHALVIGVGYYAHLPEGKGKLYPEHEGLGQLTSPPASARAFANWLLKSYRNPGKPLASLEMLVSEPGPSKFVLPDGSEKAVERAVFNKVKKAILKWNGRGDKNPEHLLIFFFCGHGVSKGYATSLLMEDFGKTPKNPLEHAVSFRELYDGMDICQARQQCYFVDACRTASPALITRYNNYTGQAVIPGSAYLAASGARTAPIYYATVPGSAAYGRTQEASVFTDALLKALKGAGSNDLEEPGVWRVDTNTLNQGLDHLLRVGLGVASGAGQVISVDELVNFTLHTLDGDPIVPVSIGCDPRAANQSARLGYQKAGQANAVLRPDMQGADWHVELELGEYRFFAEFPNGDYSSGEQERSVTPPFRRVPLEVAP